jgi:uncharacterized membrane protein YeaQ/YmgE (transglycosylase-associated protein family)
MPLPLLILGLIIALLIGALYHLWRNGGFWRFLFYLFLSLAGFFAGNWIGSWRGWILFPIGPLDLGVAIIGSLILLIVGDWLSLVSVRRSVGGDDAV